MAITQSDKKKALVHTTSKYYYYSNFTWAWSDYIMWFNNSEQFSVDLLYVCLNF